MPQPTQFDYTKSSLTPEEIDIAKRPLVTTDSEIKKGAARFVDQTQALAGGLVGLGSQALGIDSGRDWGLDVYEKNMEEATAGWQRPAVPKVEDIKFSEPGGVGRAMDWAAGAGTEGVLNLATSLVGGGVGGVVGKSLAKGAVKEAAAIAAKNAAVDVGKSVVGRTVTQEAKDAAAQKVAQAVAKGQFAGMVGGAGATSFGQEAGGAFGEMVQEGVAPEDAVGPAAAYGVAASVVEWLPEYALAKAVGLDKGMKQAIRNWISGDKEVKNRFAKALAKGTVGAAAGAATEAGEESVQELLQIGATRWAKDEPVLAALSEEDKSRILNSAAAAAIPGGLFGGGIGATKGFTAKTTEAAANAVAQPQQEVPSEEAGTATPAATETEAAPQAAATIPGGVNEEAIASPEQPGVDTQPTVEGAVETGLEQVPTEQLLEAAVKVEEGSPEAEVIDAEVARRAGQPIEETPVVEDKQETLASTSQQPQHTAQTVRSTIEKDLGADWLAAAEQRGLVEVRDESGPNGIQAEFNPSTGKISIYAQSVQGDPASVVLHEGSHQSLDVMTHGRLSGFAKEIADQAKREPAAAEAVTRAAASVDHWKQQTNNGENSSMTEAQVWAEEIFAYYVEHAKEGGLFRRAVNAVKAGWMDSQIGRAFAKAGLSPKITDGVAAALARRSTKFSIGLRDEMDALTQGQAGQGETMASFAGPRAATANTNALEAAKEYVDAGVDPEQVRQTTGWFVGDDGKWRFEVDDSAAALRGYEGSLGDVLEHSRLFEAYPQLQYAQAEIKIVPDSNRLKASFNHKNFQIKVEAPTDELALNALLHEVQHAVQKEEGFARGGKVSAFLPGGPLEHLRQPDETPNQAYMRIAGEVEARNVQIRQRMTEEERRAIGPDMTRDVAKDAVVFKERGETLASVPGPLWRSGTLDAIQSIKQNKASGEQWLNMLTQKEGKTGQRVPKLPGVSVEEMEDMGLVDWLEGRENAVGKEELVGFVRDGGVKVEEVLRTEVFPELQAKYDSLHEQMMDAQNQFGEATGISWAAVRRGRVDRASLAPEHEALLQKREQLIAERDAVYAEMEQVRSGKEPKFAGYQLPGGANYRELLITIPQPQETVLRLQDSDGKFVDAPQPNTKEGRAVLEDSVKEYNQTYREELTIVEQQRPREGTKYTSSHWSEPNVLVHLRFNERTDAEGKKVLLVEEVQSDWHQEGRKKGYKGEWTQQDREKLLDLNMLPDAVRTPEQNAELDALWIKKGGVPNAPLKSTSTWAMLGMKRAIRWAAENGFDKVAWTPGEQQAERYDLSKQVDAIRVERADDGTRTVSVEIGNDSKAMYMDVDDNGKVVFADSQPELNGKDLSDVLGKEMAEKIMAAKGDREFSGLDLKVGGEGMRAFYDRMLPNEMKKYVKKFGGKVETTEIERGNANRLYDWWFQQISQLPLNLVNKANESLSAWKDTVDAGTPKPIVQIAQEQEQSQEVIEAIKEIRSRVPDELFKRGQDVWSITITPALREEALSGQRLYSIPQQVLDLYNTNYSEVMGKWDEGQIGLAHKARLWLQDKVNTLAKLETKKGVSTEDSVYEAENKVRSKKMKENEVLDLDIVLPIMRLIAKNAHGQNKWTVATVDKALYARAAPEVNAHLREVSARLWLDHFSTTMDDEDQRKDLAADIKNVIDQTGGTYELDDGTEINDPDIKARRQLMYALAKEWASKNPDETSIPEDRIAAFWEYDSKPSGMTDADAATESARWAGNEDMAQVFNLVDEMAERSRATLVANNMISQEMAYKWQGVNPHYVTLHREGYEEQQGGKGQGYSAGRPSSIRAGSIKPAVDVLSNTIMTARRAIQLSYNNDLMQKFYAMVKNPAYDFKNEFEITKEDKVKYLDKDGFIREGMTKGERPELEARVWFNGQKYLIRAKEDNPQMRAIMAAMNNLDSPAFGPVMKTFAKANHFMARMNTALSIEFFFTNPIRDLLEAQVNMSDSEADTVRKQSLKSLPEMWKGLWQIYRGRSKGEDMSSHPLYGLVEKYEKAGIPSSWLAYHETAQDQRKALEQMIKQVSDRPSATKYAHLAATFIEDTNRMAENALRLSVFKALTDAGVTETRAATIVKELTVNFDRRGSAGPAINALYMFANASIQGSTRVLRALVTSKKVQKLAAGIVIASIITEMFNGGDDDWDKIDENKKQRNLIFRNPTGVGPEFISIPAPWGYNVLWTMGRKIGEGMRGKQGWSPSTASVDMIQNILSSFNPVQGGTLLQTVMPTLGRPLAQIYENKDWSGERPLRPEPFPGQPVPESQQMWESSSIISKTMAGLLNAATGGDKVTAGWIDVSPTSLDAWTGQIFGAAGNTVRDVLNLPAELTDPMKDFEIGRLPVLRKFSAAPNASIEGAVYHERVAQIHNISYRIKQYEEGVNRDVAKARELRRESRPLLALEPAMKEAEKQLRDLRKRLALAQASGSEERVKQMRQRMKEIRERFNQTFERRVAG